MEDPQSNPRHETLDAKASPWMARTQAWVADQEIRGPRFVSQTTRDWVWAQRMLEAEKLDCARREKEKGWERVWWEATARMIDEQAKQWMVQAEASRQAALRETEKTKRLQEEVRRIKQKGEAREAERRKFRENARKMSAESNAKARKACENAEKKLIDAWNSYERRWTTLQAPSTGRLTFRSIPWPVVGSPSNASSISSADIALFLLSPLHSANKSTKDRVREAMQRWHNDKFEPRILPRVLESDRSAVKEGVDIVVRCLNDLLSRQSPSS